MFVSTSFKPPPCSYLILNPGGVAGVADLKKVAELILVSTGLEAETYRIGNTKARSLQFLYLTLIIFRWFGTPSFWFQTKLSRENPLLSSECLLSSILSPYLFDPREVVIVRLTQHTI